MRQQVDEWVQRAADHPAKDTVGDAAESLKEKLAAVENELIQVEYQGARDRLDLPTKLNRKLAELASVVSSADFAPPRQAYEVFDYLAGEIDHQLRQFQDVIDEDVSRFASLVQELEIPTIVPRSVG